MRPRVFDGTHADRFRRPRSRPRYASVWSAGARGLGPHGTRRPAASVGASPPRSALADSRPGEQLPGFGLYLAAKEPPGVAWESRWIRWPDFGLPASHTGAREALVHAWRRAESERVEIACAGGRGRTGTALACLAVLDGVPASGAVDFVREHYDPRAVETWWQRRYVARFPSG